MALESISENVKGKNFLSCQGRGEEEGRRGGNLAFKPPKGSMLPWCVDHCSPPLSQLEALLWRTLSCVGAVSISVNRICESLDLSLPPPQSHQTESLSKTSYHMTGGSQWFGNQTERISWSAYSSLSSNKTFPPTISHGPWPMTSAVKRLQGAVWVGQSITLL